MPIPLSKQQLQALAASPDEILELIDENTQTRYVLVPSVDFERLRPLLTVEEFDLRETYAAQSRALGLAGWDDPEMDIYNDYDANKP